MRDQVEGLIIDEMRLMAARETVTTDTYIAGSVLGAATTAALRCESALVRAEMDRMRAGGVVPRIGVSPSFPPLPRADAGLEEWERALRDAEVAVEALSTRAINVDLAARYGVETWKEAAAGLDAMVAGARAVAASATGAATAAEAARGAVLAPVAARLSALAKRFVTASEVAIRTEAVVEEAEREAKRRRPCS
jgi:hypothetical protein